MIDDSQSRRRVVAAIGTGAATLLAGCLRAEICETVVEAVQQVDPGAELEESVALEPGIRIYVRSVRLNGGRPEVTIENPDGDVVRRVGPSDHLEAVYGADTGGVHTIVLRNASAVQTARWETTVVVYDGWCRTVF